MKLGEYNSEDYTFNVFNVTLKTHVCINVKYVTCIRMGILRVFQLPYGIAKIKSTIISSPISTMGLSCP